MLKARAVVKLNRVVRWPMTEALERAPNSWAARLEAIVFAKNASMFLTVAVMTAGGERARAR